VKRTLTLVCAVFANCRRRSIHNLIDVQPLSIGLTASMQIYLPIAELSVNAFPPFGVGGVLWAFLSGMFGVGRRVF